jgi:hypothetical protein
MSVVILDRVIDLVGIVHRSTNGPTLFSSDKALFVFKKIYYHDIEISMIQVTGLLIDDYELVTKKEQSKDIEFR